MRVYVYADIGCIECGENSAIRVFTSPHEAEEYRHAEEVSQQAAWTGQHYFHLYEADVDGPPAELWDPDADPTADQPTDPRTD